MVLLIRFEFMCKNSADRRHITNLKQIFRFIQHLIGNYYMLHRMKSLTMIRRVIRFIFVLFFLFFLCSFGVVSLLCVNRCNKTEIEHDFHERRMATNQLQLQLQLHGNSSDAFRLDSFVAGVAVRCIFGTLVRHICQDESATAGNVRTLSVFPCLKAINNMILLQDIPFTQVNFH